MPYAERDQAVDDKADLGNTCLENENESGDRQKFPDAGNNDGPAHDRGNLYVLD